MNNCANFPFPNQHWWRESFMHTTCPGGACPTSWWPLSQILPKVRLNLYKNYNCEPFKVIVPCECSGLHGQGKKYTKFPSKSRLVLKIPIFIIFTGIFVKSTPCLKYGVHSWGRWLWPSGGGSAIQNLGITNIWGHGLWNSTCYSNFGISQRKMWNLGIFPDGVLWNSQLLPKNA